MAGENFLTLHPDPSKKGVNIDRARYEQVKAAMLEAIGEQGELTFQRLTELMDASLTGRLEARGLIAVEWGNP